MSEHKSSKFQTAFKIFLVGMGLFDLLGLLPPSLDFLDKGLAALILFIFWMGLRPSHFLFGVKSRLFDVGIITSFYILVADTFLQILRTSEGIIGPGGLVPKSAAVLHWLISYLIDPTNATQLSIVSSKVGFVLLLVLGLLLCLFGLYKKKSVFSSVFLFLGLNPLRKDLSENIFTAQKSQKTLLLPLKFLCTILLLLFIHQYFFSLINQWFIISLDKSLLILAVLFAVKDIEHTKSKALNTIGQFDEWLLGTITRLFTDPSRLYLGLGVLFLFHYLSDLAVFFLPFLFPSLSIESFYGDLLGSGSHIPLITLFSQETFVFGVEKVFAALLYTLSGAGILFLIFIPLIVLYGVIRKADFSALLTRRWFRRTLFVVTLSVLVALVLPWVQMESIVGKGIVGVDFVTQSLSSHGFPFLVSGLLLIFVTIILYFIFTLERSIPHITFTLFVLSLIYLGQYVWHFFYSSVLYHWLSIQLLLTNGFFILSTMLSILLILEFIFYVGLFIVLSYKTLLYLSSQMIQKILSDKLIISWTIILLLIPIVFLSPTESSALSVFFERLVVATIIIGVLLIWSVALYKILRGYEFRDDFILALTITLGSYLLILIASFVFSALNLPSGIINFSQPIVLLFLSVLLLRTFGFSWDIHSRIIRRGQYLFAIVIGVLFGIGFYLIKEPHGAIFSYHIAIIAFYTLIVAVAEEIVFRGVIFRLAYKAFNYRIGLNLQALVFSLIHFGSFSFILLHYANLGGAYSAYPLIFAFVYMLLLYVFGIVQGIFISKHQLISDIPLSLGLVIIIHWITNLTAFILIV